VGGLLAGISYGLLFQVDAWTCIAAALVVWLYFKNVPQIRENDAPSAASSHYLRDKQLLLLLLVLVLNTFCYMQCISTYAIYVKEVYGLSEFSFGQLMALNCVTIMLFEMALVHYFQSRNYMRALVVGSLLSGTGYMILPHFSGFFPAAAVMMVLTVGEMLTVPTLMSLISQRAPKNQVGKYMALASGSFAAMWMIAPLVSTWIYAHWSATTLWYVVGAVAVFNSFLASRLSGSAFKLKPA
jgi:predicted MFS family arabinose efflux permease